MDAVAKRREARRRRLLKDPEERLKKIRNLNESSVTSSEGSDSNFSTDKESSSSASQNQPILQREELQASPDIKKESNDEILEHSCLKLPSSVTQTDSKTVEKEKASEGERKPAKSFSDSTPASDPFSYLPWLVTIQSSLAEFQSVNSSSSTKTAVAFAVAIVFRLSLELDWLKFVIGESMVVIFVALYLPWLYFFGINKVKIKSLLGALFISFRVIQDFACYLFAFIATHGLVSLFTQPGITDD